MESLTFKAWILLRYPNTTLILTLSSNNVLHQEIIGKGAYGLVYVGSYLNRVRFFVL